MRLILMIGLLALRLIKGNSRSLYYQKTPRFDAKMKPTASLRSILAPASGAVVRLTESTLFPFSGTGLQSHGDLHKQESAFDEILLLNEVRKGTAKRFKLPKGKVPELHELMLHLAELDDIPNFRVGPRFPIGLGRKLREGMVVSVLPGLYYHGPGGCDLISGGK